MSGTNKYIFYSVAQSLKKVYTFFIPKVIVKENKKMSKKTTVLMILDGYGLNEKTEHNAVALGKTPVMDKLMKEYPFVKGNPSRMAFVLPD